MSSNKASQSQRNSSYTSRAFTFPKVNATALLIATITIVVLLVLMSKQQTLITSLKHQSYLEDSILATEHRLTQFKTLMESGSTPTAASYAILKRELQVSYQSVSEYLNNHSDQLISPLVLSKEDFLSAEEGLAHASARHIAKTTLNLLHTLIEVPPSETAQYIQQQFSLLPMVTAIQAEEKAVLLRIQELRHKMLLTTIFGVIIIVLWYFVTWLFFRSNINKSPQKFVRSKLRLAIVDDERDLQNKEFLKLISHEFRAPISAIISALELIPNMEEQRSRLIQQAEQSSYRLLNLTNSLTDVLSNNSEDDLHFSEVDLISLLDECISPFSVRVKDKKIEFNMHCSHSVPHFAETDPVALSKVVVNILDNAVKFTANGLIDVTVTTLVKNQGIFLVIIISDTGIGIDEATQKRMFERFYRGEHSTGQRFPGAGIGLSVAKRSIDKLGGALQVTSTVGVGSEFKILLPLKPVDELPVTNATPSNAIFAVVDDLEISRLHLQSIITKEGFSARSFSSGANLLNLHEEILQFSGIIADLYMPGMNGLELVKTLQAIFGERVPPVIVLSATPDIANIIANSELPIYQSFVKPIDRNRFVDALHHLTASNAKTIESSKKANVLVVEDEPINAEMVEYMLQCMGHEVTVSYTGDDAISRVNENAFDCVLLDINLPDINGLEVAKIMKEGHPDLPIIALTANAHRNDKEASLRAGVRYHLVKPVTFQELKNTLRLAL
ncbi:hybrid sensor histidine kinase/response regulator [Alteromonas abrolhosensis]|uniref:hybrid sensor histidine kinase/response regulator n=1 Tax=Alteromonas abrolhosensis TaxID=1892904 RepID=UPI00096B8531|nr:response regulator [Alteromonas abrolhosensis]